MKFKDIRDLSLDDLNKKKRELVDELFQAKMKNGLGQLGNPLVIRQKRKDVARVKTAIQAKNNG